MIGSSEARCFGKKVYASYWKAARSSKRLNRSQTKAHANPYRCATCHFWHVGNTMGEMHRRVKSRRELREDVRRGRIKFSE